MSGAAFANAYGVPDPGADIRQPVTVTVGQDGTSAMSMVPDAAAPALWTSMAHAGSTKDRLMADVRSFTLLEDGLQARVSFVWEPIRFVKLRAVTQAALDYAGTAVTIALGLIGIMALWLGVMKVAEEAGILKIVTRALTPVTRRLFPDVPPDHPAVGAIIMNISANMLGLSNAATPMGLKAMEELNKLNPARGRRHELHDHVPRDQHRRPDPDSRNRDRRPGRGGLRESRHHHRDVHRRRRGRHHRGHRRVEDPAAAAALPQSDGGGQWLTSSAR